MDPKELNDEFIREGLPCRVNLETGEILFKNGHVRIDEAEDRLPPPYSTTKPFKDGLAENIKLRIGPYATVYGQHVDCQNMDDMIIAAYFVGKQDERERRRMK